MGYCAELKDWTQIDHELTGAGYPGPFDHGPQEVAAYQNAAHCTPCIAGYNSTACAGGSGGTGAAPAGGAGGTGLMAWVRAHPLATALGVGLVVLLLKD